MHHSRTTWFYVKLTVMDFLLFIFVWYVRIPVIIFCVSQQKYATTFKHQRISVCLTSFLNIGVQSSFCKRKNTQKLTKYFLLCVVAAHQLPSASLPAPTPRSPSGFAIPLEAFALQTFKVNIPFIDQR